MDPPTTSVFQLESNGTLSTAEIFDYEALLETHDANLSIRVRISDSENLFFEDSLFVLVTDEFEDLDQDGISIPTKTVTVFKPVGSGSRHGPRNPDLSFYVKT